MIHKGGRISEGQIMAVAQETPPRKQGNTGRCYGWLRVSFGAILLCAAGVGAYQLFKRPLPPCSPTTSAMPRQVPRLVVPSCPLDLGQGAPGDILTGTVSLRNAGGAVLEIKEIKPGCGCASISWDTNLIPPGESVDLRVGARLRVEGERLGFSLAIHSNDPQFPLKIYHVQAHAPAFLRTDPTHVHFGDFAIGTSPKQTVRLLQDDGTPWPSRTPLSFSSEQGLFICALRKQAGKDGAALVIDLEPKRHLPAGRFSDSLIISNRGAARTLRVSVEGFVATRFQVSPTALDFGATSLGDKPAQRRFIIRRTDGKTVPAVAKIVAPDGVFVSERKTTGLLSPNTRQFEASWDPSATGKDLEGHISIRLDGEAEALSVTILGFSQTQRR